MRSQSTVHARSFAILIRQNGFFAISDQKKKYLEMFINLMEKVDGFYLAGFMYPKFD